MRRVRLRTIAGTIAGVLDDGTPFSLDFTRQFIGDDAAQVFLVPEPTGLSLAILALISLVRRKR